MATIAEPAVHGALPASLSARWVGLGLGSVPAGERSCPSRAAVHVLTVHGGRATYQHRIVAFDAAAHLPRADAGRAATGVVAFAGSATTSAWTSARRTAWAISPSWPTLRVPAWKTVAG